GSQASAPLRPTRSFPAMPVISCSIVDTASGTPELINRKRHDHDKQENGLRRRFPQIFVLNPGYIDIVNHRRGGLDRAASGQQVNRAKEVEKRIRDICNNEKEGDR